MNELDVVTLTIINESPYFEDLVSTTAYLTRSEALDAARQAMEDELEDNQEDYEGCDIDIDSMIRNLDWDGYLNDSDLGMRFIVTEHTLEMEG